MADISKIKIENASFDIKDTTSRNLITTLNTNIGDLTDLNTSVKTSIVGAINSALNTVIGTNTLPEGTSFHILAGAIRQDQSTPTTWNWIDDTNHTKIGFDDTITAQGTYAVRVTYDQAYDKVITFIAAPDNELAGNGQITCGASVGLSYSDIYLGTCHDYIGDIYYDGTNWIDTNGGTVTFTNGILYLTPNPNHILFPAYSVWCDGLSRGYNTVKTPTTLQGSGVRFRFYDNNGNIVTTASTDMALRYHLGGNGRTVNLGYALGASSNIWIFGVMAKYPENQA